MSRTIWSSFNKEGMSVALSDSTVAGPAAQRDNALASTYEYPPFRTHLLIGEKLKGNLLKGSFDERVRIGLPVPLRVPTSPPPIPTPFRLTKYLITSAGPTLSRMSQIPFKSRGASLIFGQV